jgi:signal transduction histidine kinase/DNA-binding NarL/FixJ family response regulator
MLAPLILIVDDEVTTTIMLQHVFEREGYRVARVNNGPEALRFAAQNQPDLILLDILMPGMNGFEVLRKLRDDEQTATIPTILITANARQPADVARGLGLGADDYVTKPFAPQELIARAQSKIRSRQLEENLASRTRELEVLLGASELLSQRMSRAELLDLAPSLLLDLLPGDRAAIALYDGADNQRLISRSGDAAVNQEAFFGFLNQLDMSGDTLLWPGDQNATHSELGHGVASELRHSDTRLGRIAVAGAAQPYEPNHLRLFSGIVKQIGLAIQNARLNEFQENYASQLEEEVAIRTAELQSAQKLLIRTEKLASIGHLAASIAHEINNPLMPIRTLLESIVEDMQDRNIDYDRQSVEIIQASIERIRGIVSRLLEFSREPNAEMAMLDVNEVVESVVALNRKFFQHEQIEIVEVLRPLPPIFASKDQLGQVFMNMTLNAQAAMKGGGTLTVRTYAEPRFAVVEFTDTGVGIAAADLDKIFDPFFSTKPNGTGLGLFVSHGIIEAHNGSIEVRSTPGQGTTFLVRLPIHR